MFCPKCGSLLQLNKHGKKKVLHCNCGYTDKDLTKLKLKEELGEKRPLEVVDKEIETLPETEAECPKCHNKKAYYWLVQTRAGDEPETKFLKCTKCKHTWRDYS